MILLGWEIGTGRRVEIPETGHLAWFGQTQLSGKTTALEAIAFRGELRAVAFITKQGEGGFLTGRMIPPYFSEPTNDEEQPLWRWVKSILEAGQQRRMNFEESWIIRACEDPRQAKTLAEVHANIKSLLGGEGDYVEKGRGKKKKREWKYTRKPVTGINAGVYTSLKAYFDIVMPQLARLPYTKKLVLGPGLNVMDLREYAMETQALVIRSVMEWVYQHEKGVRVIVPEAQDFVPQGKNSPVKMACETLVRKAGANKNFMWLDSQDMAAVDKIMLRACSIVGVGVQTEGHEIDRSLASLFTPALRPLDIAKLKIGEFFVRVPEARVTKVYVQPAWMDSELHAQAIARGEESVSTARQMLRAFKNSRNVVIDDGTRTAGKTTPLKLLHAKPPELLQVQIQEQSNVEKDEDGETSEGTRQRRQASNYANTKTESGIHRADKDDQCVSESASERTFRAGDIPLHGLVRSDDAAWAEKESQENLSEATNVEESQSVPYVDAETTAGTEGANRDDRAGTATRNVTGAADRGALRRPGSRANDSPKEASLPVRMAREEIRRETDDRQQKPSPSSPIPNDEVNHATSDTEERYKTSTSTSYSGHTGNLRDGEAMRETGAFPEAVSGASVSRRRSENQSTGASPMPQEKTPVETMTDLLNSKGAEIPAWFAQPLRDLLRDHAALIEAHDALAERLRKIGAGAVVVPVAGSLPMSDADHEKFEQAGRNKAPAEMILKPDSRAWEARGGTNGAETARKSREPRKARQTARKR